MNSGDGKFFLSGLLIILAAFSNPVSAQNYFFENYTSEKGLSQNSCYSIEQDSDGFIWFGTQDGLNRYDGNQFKVYLPQNQIGRNLPSNFISSLYFDKVQKLLWVGTIQGICIYNPAHDSLYKVTDIYPYAQSIKDCDVKKIISFDKDEYWVVTYSKGLIRLNTLDKKEVVFFSDTANSKKVTSVTKWNGRIIASVQQRLYELNVSSAGKSVKNLLPVTKFPEIKELYSYKKQLWIGTLNYGIYIAEAQGKDTIITSLSTSGGAGCFTVDNGGKIWIGTRGNGIKIYDPATKDLATTVSKSENDRTLGKNFVLSLFTDRQGIIWAGLSGGGVSKHDPLNYQFQNFGNETGNSNSLPDNMVFDIYKAKNERYYIGTQTQGLIEWNGKQNKFIPFNESYRFGNISNTIYDITEDKKNNLWVASWGGLLKLNTQNRKLDFYKDPKFLTSQKLYGILKLRNADSLFITGENGLAFFSLKDYQWKPCKPEAGSFSYIARYIHEDENNILWISSIGQGLLKYDIRNNKITVCEQVRKISKYVRYIFRDGSNFWLATDNGVVVYNYKNETVVRHISISINGAINQSGVVYAIEKDRNGDFWASSNNGLYKIDGKKYTLLNYSRSNGLSFLEYNTACILKEEDGSIILGGVGGITKFNPAALKTNTFSPPPTLTAIIINGNPWNGKISVSHLKELKLPYNENFLTLVFAVNNFSGSPKNNFYFRLLGVNNEWVNNGNHNMAGYTALSPGEYIFQLQSSNSDGVKNNNITTLKIIIQPPWWQTSLFYASLFSLIVGSIFLLTKKRIGDIRKEAKLKQKIAENETMLLRLQMNPHFIFNSLNSINSFIVENKTHLASDYLTKFSRLIRLILENSKNEFIPLEKELETMKLYLLMESLRFKNQFEYNISIDENTDEQYVRVPPLIIQPYAENAIWHGLMHQDKKGRLDIIIKMGTNFLHIEILDNGIGRDKAAQLNSKKSNEQKSYGMEITSKRITSLHPDNRIEITDLKNDVGQPAGTRVTIFISISKPLSSKKKNNHTNE